MKKIILISLIVVILATIGVISFNYLYKPDLVILNVSVSSEYGGSVDCAYNVRVKNQGFAPAKDLFYLCYSFGVLNVCNSGSVANMGLTGETVIVSPNDQYSLVIYSPCLPPSEKLYFKIDAPENFIRESNENNNDFTLTQP